MTMGSEEPAEAVFTIATGKPVYRDMASALARSVLLWNDISKIPFYIVTDVEGWTPPQDLEGIRVVVVKKGQYGQGFVQKLYLDKLAPAQRSLFIDADSLCVGSLSHVFSAFRYRSVATIGREISDQIWGGADVAQICRKYRVDAIPRFNGGVYYLEKDSISAAVYETARSLLDDYHENGFQLLRGTPNDEYLVSIAMALHGQKPIPETGTVMNSLLAGPGGVDVDVIAGRSLLRNPKAHASYNPWYIQEELRPTIVHFCGADPHEGLYAAQIKTLQLVLENRIPVSAARVWTNVTVLWPGRLITHIKRRLRPAFHKVFGVRQMRKSIRT